MVLLQQEHQFPKSQHHKDDKWYQKDWYLFEDEIDQWKAKKLEEVAEIQRLLKSLR